MVSSTVRSSNSPPSCNTAPTWPLVAARFGACPKVVKVPAFGSVNPRTMSSRVVFPAPLAPNRARTSPGVIVRLTSLTAVTEPKRLVTPAISMTGGVGVVVFILLVFRTVVLSGTVMHHGFAMTVVMGEQRENAGKLLEDGCHQVAVWVFRSVLMRIRSEERRVGNGWGCGWTAWM